MLLQWHQVVQLDCQLTATPLVEQVEHLKLWFQERLTVLSEGIIAENTTQPLLLPITFMVAMAVQAAETVQEDMIPRLAQKQGVPGRPMVRTHPAVMVREALHAHLERVIILSMQAAVEVAAHVRLVAQVVQEAEALVEHLPHPHLTQVQQEPLTLAAVEVAEVRKAPA